jgi:hypothetical protein
MELVKHLDDLGISLNTTLSEFIKSIEGCKLPKGTFFSGTVHFSDLPPALVQGEVQGVIGYIAGDMLIDMTLTSVDMPTRWTCSFRTWQGVPKWIERK